MSCARDLDALVAGTLDSAAFPHTAHLGVACAALERFEFFDAYSLLAGGLRDMAVRAGVPEKFSATVTFAFLSVIAERRGRATYAGPEDFVARNPDLCDRGFPGRLYSAERLAEPLARSVPLLPDMPSHPGPPRV